MSKTGAILLAFLAFLVGYYSAPTRAFPELLRADES